MLQNEKLYETSGKKTSGIVESKFVSETRNSKNNTTSKSYNVKYKFTDERGIEIQGEDGTNSDNWESLIEGKSVEIEYIPGQSKDKNRIFDGNSDGSIAGYFFMGFAFLIDVLGIAFLFSYFKKRALYKRLYKEGALVDGEVTGVEQSNFSVNGVRQCQLRYTYKDLSGKTHMGKSTFMPPKEAGSWDIGDKCKIRFDKMNPTVNIFVGK